jgi:hypothetical protein
MDIMRDILPKAKRPIVALVVLYYLQLGLVAAIDVFTGLKGNQGLNILVLGGISLAFTICAWIVIAWAGFRVAKATRGGPIDGAFGGAMAAVIAGLFVRIISLLFSMSTLPVLIAYSPSGSAVGFASGLIGIFFGIVAVILGFFADLVVGAIIGFLGATVQRVNPAIFSAYGFEGLKPAEPKAKAGAAKAKRR